jgi:hypothetical protein
LQFREVAEFSVADGIEVRLSLFHARIQWCGGARDVLDGGAVTITPLG